MHAIEHHDPMVSSGENIRTPHRTDLILASTEVVVIFRRLMIVSLKAKGHIGGHGIQTDWRGRFCKIGCWR